MRLADSSIRRPVFAVMLIGSLVVLGFVSIPRLGIALFPRVEYPLVTVSAVLPGASPETMEREVSQVLEEAVNTVEGIRSLRSASSDAFSLVFVEFELRYDIQEKAQQVRERVAAVRADLPIDLEPPVIDRLDPDAAPILSLILAGPYDIRSLSELADKRIKPKLERISGVGSVTLTGDRPREIRIWLDPLRLGGYGLSVDDILAAIRREHVELPGGRLETPQSEYVIKTSGKFRNPEGLGEIAVLERAGGVVHLRDVASIEDGLAEERSISRLNGRRGVALLIRKQSGENTVAVAREVKRVAEEIRHTLPPGIEMRVALDSSDFIVSAIVDVAIAIAWGALLASLVVLAFLRDMRATLIIAVAIPSSVIATFVFFYALDFTLNTMTLMALSLSIGLLIDDAIVVLENIHRHSELGEAPMDAASKGTDEIGLAVVANTLANCAVYVPIAFLSGVVGRFFREFGLVAAGAVTMSMLVSLTLTPMLCSRYLRLRREHGRAYELFERAYQRMEAHYRRSLAWGLRHRPSVIGLALLAVLGGVWMVRSVPIEFVTMEDRSEFNVWLKLPLGSTLSQTDYVSREFERLTRELPEVTSVFATVGSVVKKRVNEAILYVQLAHKGTREREQHEIMDDLRRRIAAQKLAVEDYSVEDLPIISMPGSRNAQIMYSVRGPEMAQLQFYARSLVERMREAGGYVDLNLSYELGKPEISLEIERERAASLGVSALQIGHTVSAFFAGVKAATFEEAGERYDVRVQVRPEYRDDIEELSLVRVRSASGALVPLRNLVRPRIGSGPVQIDREARTRAITIRGNLIGKGAADADREIARFARELQIGGEYEFAAAGPTKRLRETLSAVVFAFLMALLAIYMILAAQFNSFIHPYTIMLSAPLSFIGAFAALLLWGSSLDVLGQIAFLMLMGVVMKNGILLVDYTNTLRERGLDLHAAVLEAGPTRMRPVLMTAVSTIFGLLPLVLGQGDGSEWRSPMGLIAAGGLATSTLLTLLIVPVAYTLFDDAQSGLLRIMGIGSRKSGG